MIVRVFDDFLIRVIKYNFRFFCEACVYYNEETGCCGNLFPNSLHKKENYIKDGKLTTQYIVFCKEFEGG